MAPLGLVLVLCLAASRGLAAPREDEAPRCSTECPVTGSPKLAYEPGKTYTYAYSGKSKVQLKGVQDGDSDIEWAAGIDLTWITPCDVAISFTNIKMDGAPGPDAARTLQRFPMVVAVADGRVQHVCAHPEDQPWAINLKKGVASALQNSIPSLSPVASRITVTETDVIGKCPTKYEVETEGGKLIVTKEKEHRHCTEHFPTPFEVPAPWMKAPLPLEESRSECKQVIENGIYTAITCEDKHIVRPAFGLYKYVEANQESTLRFVSESSDTSAISGITRGELEIESLLFNRKTTKDPELAPEIDELMKEICDKIENTVEADAAALVDKALHMLRSVPAEVVEEVAEKVRGGRYCGHSERLESIFFDAVAFVHESGAVKVMVEEIENGRATGGRLALYTAALYFTPRPNIKAVEALTPLFESAHSMPSVMLAAASMVNKYCHLTPECHQEAAIERIARELANKVEHHCTPSAGEETKEEAIAALKALGNMGVVTPAVTVAAVTCIEKHEVATTIRVAAAQTFRQANCYRLAVENLVDIATNPAFETEVRIASYLSAITCTEMEDIKKIISKITGETNTQVRGFIMGHLLNIQESTSPVHEHLRYLLTDFDIPTDFERDFRRVSRNVMMRYHSAAFGMGADVESNIIYAPGVFVPRALTMNLKADIDETHLDIGEIGARFEGVDSIIEELFGPEGYVRKASFGKILEDITGFAEEKGYKVMEHLENTLRTRRSIDASTIADFFNKLYGERASDIRAEVFARIMGQEVTYANIAETLKGVTADKIIETFFSLVDDSLEELKGLNLNTARAAQLHLYYSLPTIQGLPLKITLEGTAVAGLKMEGNFNIAHILANPGNLDTGIKLYPGLSIHTTGFVGFDAFIAKAGIEMKNTISSATGAAIKLRTTDNKKIEMELELPEKMELINIKAETYLVKAVGKNVRKIAPSSMRDERFAHEACIHVLEPALGLKVCYNINIPDIFRALLRGRPAIAKVFIEKTDPSMTGYLVSAAIKKKSGNKMVTIKMKAVGASTPREAQMTLTYTMEKDSHFISAKVDSLSLDAGVWATLTNTEEYKVVETFYNFKTNETDISQGLKGDLSIKANGGEKEYSLNLFSSRTRTFTNDSRILEASFNKKSIGSEVKVDVMGRIPDGLSENVALNFEVGVDLMAFSNEVLNATKNEPGTYRFYPTNLHKFELYAKNRDWEVTSFVRKVTESADIPEYILSFVVNRGRDSIITFTAHKHRGRLPRDLILEHEAIVAIGRSSYRAVFDVFNHDLKKGFTGSLTRINDNKKMAEMEAIYKQSGKEHNAKFLVEISEYINRVIAEAKITKEGFDRFVLLATVKHGQQSFLEIAPMVVQSSFFIDKLQTNITLSTPYTDPIILATNLLFDNKNQVIALEIRKGKEPAIGVEWKMVKESSRKTSLGVSFVLPFAIESRIYGFINEDLLHVNFNNLVLPRKPSQRRVKGFIDIVDKKTNMQLAWDADRNPKSKLEMNTTVVSSSASPAHAEIQGNIVFAGEQYHMKLVFTYDMWAVESDNAFTLVLVTPAQKTLSVEATSRVELEAAITNAIRTLKYKNFEGKEYKVTSIIHMEQLGGPSNYATQAEVIYTTPGQADMRLETAFKHQKTPETYVLVFEVAAALPMLKKPVAVSFTIDNAEGSYVGAYKFQRGSEAAVSGWNLKISPEAGIEVVEAALDVTRIVETLEIARAIATFEDERSMSPPSQTTTYFWKLKKLSPSSYTLFYKTPSSTAEGEATLSPWKSRIKFQPNKDKFESSYEIGYKLYHEGFQGPLSFEFKIKHPSLSRPILATAKYTHDGETRQGTVEMDIFREEADKIIGMLGIKRISEYSIMTEGSITGRLLRVNPKVMVTVTHAPTTQGFDVVLHNNSLEAPILMMLAKYDKTAARTISLTSALEMENRPIFGFSGTIQLVEEGTCDGLRMEAITFARAFGAFDVASKMCKPDFVELTANRYGNKQEYMTRVGLCHPDTTDVGLHMASREKEFCRDVAAVTLPLPTVLKIETSYNFTVRMLEKKLTEAAMKFVAFIKASFMEGAEEGIRFPETQLVTLANEVKAEAAAIYRDLLAELRIFDPEVNAVLVLLPKGEVIKHMVADITDALARDIVLLREWIMDIPAVEKTIKPLTSGKAAKKIVSALLKEIINASVEEKGNRSVILIPHHRQLYSLAQVPKAAVPYFPLLKENLFWAYSEYIPILTEDLIWAYYNFVPRHLTEVTDMLPPFPRVAMVVGGTEILTFDGLVVRAPRSPCKVLLAAHGTHRLIMSHPQASAPPQLELTTPEATIVIKPDFEVIANGRPVRAPVAFFGKVRIQDKGEHIEVACPVMKVIVAKSGEVVAVEASGWLFGRVAGLLGPNNGEVADNLLMPNGEATPNPRELVSAWQEDKQCSTPEVPRAETSVARVVECEAFLGIRSRCNPVVRPHPFMEMCHAAHDACDAAKAYRTICTLKGVEVFPSACVD